MPTIMMGRIRIAHCGLLGNVRWWMKNGKLEGRHNRTNWSDHDDTFGAILVNGVVHEIHGFPIIH